MTMTRNSAGTRWSGWVARLLFWGAAGLLAMPVAHAGEAGLSNFPYGAQTTYSAYMPQPGNTSFFGYALYYNANSVRDHNGDSIPGVKVDVLALAPRLVHTWTGKLAGFDLSSGAVVEGVWVKVKAPGAVDRDTGPTLLGIEPLYITRSFGAVRFLTGPLIYFPLGPYDKTALANSTPNYHSLAYQVSSTWTPTPDWDVSLNAAVEHKEKNKETDYRSGTQAGLTYGVGYRPFTDKRWDLGFSGFYTDQFNNDKIDGDSVPGGGKTRKFAIGPKAVYWINPGTALVAQWHHEMDVRNAPRGDLFWLECAFPL